LKKRQTSIDTAFKKFDQMKALKLYYTFFIQDIVPAHVTDSPALEDFLNYVRPDFNIPSRRKLTRDIARLGEEAKGIMGNLLGKVYYVATSADSWSAPNRSFIGMTVHWIDPASLKRGKGCPWDKGDQSAADRQLPGQGHDGPAPGVQPHQQGCQHNNRQRQ
jgi:hypothetical protein